MEKVVEEVDSLKEAPKLVAYAANENFEGEEDYDDGQEFDPEIEDFDCDNLLCF